MLDAAVAHFEQDGTQIAARRAECFGYRDRIARMIDGGGDQHETLRRIHGEHALLAQFAHLREEAAIDLLPAAQAEWMEGRIRILQRSDARVVDRRDAVLAHRAATGKPHFASPAIGCLHISCAHFAQLRGGRACVRRNRRRQRLRRTLELRGVEVCQLRRRHQCAGADQLAEHRNFLAYDERLDLGDSPLVLADPQAELPWNVGFDDAAEERWITAAVGGEIDVVGTARGERSP
jgi:hypothetical protein